MYDGSTKPPSKLSGEQAVEVSFPATDLEPSELLELANALQVSQETLIKGMGVDKAKVQKVSLPTVSYGMINENGDVFYMPDHPSEIGVVGDKGPEGEQGPPGYPPLGLGKNEPTAWYPNGPEEEESTSPKIKLLEGMNKGITLQDIIGSKEVAATETGAVVLMPQEFDADNVQAYIQQEIEAGIKEHQTELMRKVADVLADTLVEERKAAKDAAHEASCRAKSLRAYLDAHRLEAEEFDKKRALDIAELHLKVDELRHGLEEKTKETKILREKLHAASMKKPVRKIGKVNSVINGAHGTSKAGNDP